MHGNFQGMSSLYQFAQASSIFLNFPYCMYLQEETKIYICMQDEEQEEIEPRA